MMVIPEDEVAVEYVREAEQIERYVWDDICAGGVRAGLGGAELERAKRLRAEAAERHR